VFMYVNVGRSKVKAHQ